MRNAAKHLDWNEPLLGLLTGPVGVGKTTVAERVAGLALRRGLACGGLLAPALRDSCGRKAGIWGIDAHSGERRILARTDRDLGGPRTGPYSFDPASLSWAVGVIEQAASPPLAGGTEGGACDLLLVDEIGKLELWQAAGLAPVIPWLAAGRARRALVIVRDSLLEELQDRLGPIEQVVFRATEENRDALPAQILERLMADSG